jgi:HlyD family secretion protein
MRLSALYPLVFCALFSSLVHAQKAPEPTAAAAPVKPALTVSTVKPQTTTLKQSITANGTVAAWQEASVSAEVSGLRLDSLSAQVGDTVKKGQILATFSQDSLNAEIAATRAQLAEAQANFEETKANATRARDLAAQGFYSAQAQTQTIAQEKAAQARLDAAKANVTLQELRLAHSVLRAPDAGVITARNAAVGSVVAAGTELFRMNRQNRLEWRGEVTVAELAQIQRGSAVSLDGGNGAGKVAGVVRQIAPNLDPQTRNAVVYVDVLGASALKVGQFVRGEFAGASSTATTLPAGAIVPRDGFNYVFVLAGSKVVQTKITLGARSGGLVAVQGLKLDAAVVASGAAFLTDGDTVKVVQP